MSRPRPDQPVLIAYDGSPHAKAAVEQAARLLPEDKVVVVTVWQSLRPIGGMALLGLPADVAEQALGELDRAAADGARACAEEGARLAERAGLEARPRAAPSEGPIWQAVIQTADEEDARAVIVGSRGRSAIASAMLGSVSNGVVQHCRRPVLVVTADSADA